MKERVYRILVQQISENSICKSFYDYVHYVLSPFTYQCYGEPANIHFLPSNRFGDERKKITRICISEPVGDYLEIKVISNRLFPGKWEKQLFKVLDCLKAKAA